MNIDVHEMKLRILGEFDDKDMENVFSTLNAVINPSGNLSELATFCAALTELVVSDVVVLGFEKKSFEPEAILDRDGSLDLVARLPAWFKFDQERKIWNRSGGAFRVDPTPFVMLTDTGMDKALEVRKRFAFRWWEKAGSADKP